jgi:hypothetical protein
MFIWLTVRAFQRPKWEKEITERRSGWFDFRANRLDKLLDRKPKEEKLPIEPAPSNEVPRPEPGEPGYNEMLTEERLKKYDDYKKKHFPWLLRRRNKKSN